MYYNSTVISDNILYHNRVKDHWDRQVGTYWIIQPACASFHLYKYLFIQMECSILHLYRYLPDTNTGTFKFICDVTS